MTEQRTNPDRRMTDGRRASDQEWREAHEEITRRLEEGDRRMNAQDAAIAENTTLTQEVKAMTLQVKANTDAIVETFQSWTGAAKVVDSIGKLAKPVGYIIMSLTAAIGFITALKSGTWWDK